MGLSDQTPADLPRWLWLWIPLGIAAAQLLARALDGGSGLYFVWFEGEIGVIELGTFAVLLPAIGLALAAWRQQRGAGIRWLAWWLPIFAVGAVYFAGEEVSWGQHFVGWSSPEFFQRYNIQNETNLHNLGLKVDRIPKFVVAAVVLIAGLILPLVRHFRGTDWGPGRTALYWLLPTMAGAGAAGLAIAFRLAERIKTWFDLEALPFFDINLKETHEFFIALFFALYAASLWSRLRARARTAD